MKIIILVLTALVLGSSCTTVTAQTTASLTVQRTNSPPETLQYQSIESYDITAVAVVCAVTAIVYGGGCWYYLFTPGPFDRQAATDSAHKYVESLGSCVALADEPKTVRLGFDPVPTSRRVTSLAGTAIPDSALKSICASAEEFERAKSEAPAGPVADMKSGIVSTDYDRFKDITRIVAPLKISPSPMSSTLVAVGPGKQLGDGVVIGVLFEVDSRDWRYLKCHSVGFLVDGVPVHVLDEPKHVGDVRKGSVNEKILARLSRESIVAMSRASSVEVQICKDEFRLAADSYIRFGEFANALQLEAPGKM